MKKVLAYFLHTKLFVKICLFSVTIALTSGCVPFFTTDKSFHKPSPLPEISNNEVAFVKVWKQTIGNNKESSLLKLKPVIFKNTIYAASSSGVVMAIDKKTGRKIWSTKLKHQINSGPGTDGKLLVLGIQPANIIALDAKTGKEKWTEKTEGEILAIPAVAKNRVAIQALNGKISTFNATTGEQLWQENITLPTLLLRGSASPIIYQDSVITGLPNGNVMCWNLQSGTLLWSNNLVSEQSSENQLVDINATPLVVNDTLYAINYGGDMKAINIHTGETLWSHKAAGYYDMSDSGNYIYFSDLKSNLISIEKDTGNIKWSADKLAYRYLSAPAVYRNYVLTGDYQGYIHALSKFDGQPKGRYHVYFSGGISTQPLVDHEYIYIFTNKGDLVALTVEKKKSLVHSSGCKICDCYDKVQWNERVACLSKILPEINDNWIKNFKDI